MIDLSGLLDGAVPRPRFVALCDVIGRVDAPVTKTPAVTELEWWMVTKDKRRMGWQQALEKRG